MSCQLREPCAPKLLDICANTGAPTLPDIGADTKIQEPTSMYIYNKTMYSILFLSFIYRKKLKLHA